MACSECNGHSFFQDVLAVPGRIGHALVEAGEVTIKAPGYLCGKVVSVTSFCGRKIESARDLIIALVKTVAQAILSKLLSFAGIDIKQLTQDLAQALADAQKLKDDIARLEHDIFGLQQEKATLTARVAELTPKGWRGKAK